METHHHPRLDAISVQHGLTVMRLDSETRPAPCRLPALYAIARARARSKSDDLHHQRITEGAVASRRSRCRS